LIDALISALRGEHCCDQELKWGLKIQFTMHIWVAFGEHSVDSCCPSAFFLEALLHLGSLGVDPSIGGERVEVVRSAG